MFSSGLKFDLKDNRKVPKEAGENFAKTNNMRFVEVSAKTDAGIKDLENILAKIIYEEFKKDNVYEEFKKNKKENKKKMKVMKKEEEKKEEEKKEEEKKEEEKKEEMEQNCCECICKFIKNCF